MDTPKKSNKFMLCLLIYMEVLPFALIFVIMFLKYRGVIGANNADTIQDLLVFWQEPVLFVLPVVIYMIFSGTPLGCMMPFKKLSFKNAILIVVMTLLFMPTMALFSSIANFFIENEVNAEITEMVKNMDFKTAIVSFAVMPAIFEEFIFRGVIMSGYKKTGMLKAVCAAALFFGMMHMDWFQLIYTVIAGIVLGIFVYCTNSVFASMLGHFVLNGIQIAFQLLVFKFADPETIEETLEYVQTFQDKIDSLIFCSVWTVFTLPVFIILLRYFIKRNGNGIFEYKYGITDRNINISILDADCDKKIVDNFFVSCIVIYLIFMFINSMI